VFFGNFDFEHDLAAGTMAEIGMRAAVRQAGTERARAWVAVAAAEDLVFANRPVDPAEFADLVAAGSPVPRFFCDLDSLGNEENLELVPWGWTPATPALAAERGWACRGPACEIVRQVNSRAFRWELEAGLGVSLPGSAVARSIEGLRKIIATAGVEGWILKSNYGMAGRESVRGRGPSLTDPLVNWARKRIDQTGCVVFEPMVSRLAEAGIQIEIPPEGRPTLVGVTPLLVDSSGTYRGSRFGSQEADFKPWTPALDAALDAADRMQQLGYFGPLGIDAMWYRGEEGRPRLRPLQDLNARWTMGRLALGFMRILPTGWCASWLHPRRRPASCADLASLAELPVVQERRARVLSTALDAEGAHASILVLADSPEARADLESALFEAKGGLALEAP
jgi:hypothetical protein